MSRRRWVAAIGGIAATVGVTACSGSDASETDLESAETSEAFPSTASTGPLAGYSSEEIAAYDEALAALKHNLDVGLEVYSEGLATPAAYRALASIYTGEELADEWENLRNMDAAGGYLEGSATVEWAKPVRILVSDQAGTVDISACIDRSQMRAYKRGDGEIEDPGAFKRAVFEVTVDLGDGDVWRVAGGEETGTC